MSDKSTGLLPDMSKRPPLSPLKPLLDHCHVVKRVFLKGHSTNQKNNYSAKWSEIFKFIYKRIPGTGDELADYLHISGIRDGCVLLQASDR